MSVESPPWALQSGSFSAEQTRRAVFMWAARTAANTPGILQGGLASAADCQVTAPGSGLSVNVSTGEMLIPGNEGGTQGGAYARISSTTNAAVTTANPTNPRIDRIVALMSDAGYTEPTGGSGSQWAVSVVTGTATAGATLVNLSGAAAVPGSSLLLANLLVPATATNIITADIANVAKAATMGLPAPYAFLTGLAYSPNNTTSYATIGASTMTVLCTGQPMLAVAGPISVQLTGAPAYNSFFGFSVDSAAPVGVQQIGINSTGGQNTIQTAIPWTILAPAAGSHTIALQQKVDSTAGIAFPSSTGQIAVFQI